jgi:hypothetical protein
LVNICLIRCPIESQPNTTILPEFCYIPLLLMDGAARLELRLWHCRLQFIFLPPSYYITIEEIWEELCQKAIIPEYINQ